jgi:hypothetical protein
MEKQTHVARRDTWEGELITKRLGPISHKYPSIGHCSRAAPCPRCALCSGASHLQLLFARRNFQARPMQRSSGQSRKQTFRADSVGLRRETVSIGVPWAIRRDEARSNSTAMLMF